MLLKVVSDSISRVLIFFWRSVSQTPLDGLCFAMCLCTSYTRIAHLCCMAMQFQKWPLVSTGDLIQTNNFLLYLHIMCFTGKPQVRVGISFGF